MIRDLYEMARLPVPREYSGVRGLARAPWDECDATEEELDAADARAALMAAEDEAAANDSAPSDAELAADESVSAFIDSITDGFVEWLSAQVEEPGEWRHEVAA